MGRLRDCRPSLLLLLAAPRSATATIIRDEYVIPARLPLWACDEPEDIRVGLAQRREPVPPNATIGFLTFYNDGVAREEAAIAHACFERAFGSTIPMTIVDSAPLRFNEKQACKYAQHGTKLMQYCWNKLMEIKLATARSSPYDITVMVDADLYANPRLDLTELDANRTGARTLREKWAEEVARTLLDLFRNQAVEVIFPLLSNLDRWVHEANDEKYVGGSSAWGNGSVTATKRREQRRRSRADAEATGYLRHSYHPHGAATANGGFIVYRKGVATDRFFGCAAQLMAEVRDGVKKQGADRYLITEMHAYRRLLGKPHMRSVAVQYIHPVWWCFFVPGMASISSSYPGQPNVQCPFVHGDAVARDSVRRSHRRGPRSLVPARLQGLAS